MCWGECQNHKEREKNVQGNFATDKEVKDGEKERDMNRTIQEK